MALTRTLLLAFGALLVSLATTGSARADHAPEPEPARLRSGFASQDRPIGMAEFGMGVLTLPGAEVCSTREGSTTASSNCTTGDTSFEVEAWPLYRPSVRYALGAGIMLGLIPTTIPPQDEDPNQNIERDHSRSYLTVEGVGRYYLYVGEAMEFWVGVTGGLVVVSDRFVVENGVLADRALVGQKGVTIRTEGGTVGLAAGGAFAFAQNWSLGVMLRYGQWFLPSTPAKDPLGSEASLTGRNSYGTLGVAINYRSLL